MILDSISGRFKIVSNFTKKEKDWKYIYLPEYNSEHTVYTDWLLIDRNLGFGLYI
jgi:hypothetical protein